MLLLLVAVGTAAGQINLSDLATTGDGSAVYFTSTLSLRDESPQPGLVPGRIFRIGPQGFELYMYRSRIGPPPVTCWAWGADNATRLDVPVLYSGLAPRLTGIYKIDVRVPASNLRASLQLNCAGEGDNTSFYGSFAVKP